MSLVKVGKTFHYDFIFAGKRYRKTTKTFDKKLATKVEQEKRQEVILKAISPIKAEGVTLASLFERCYKERWQFQKDGLRSYERGNKIIELVGDISLASPLEELQSYVSRLLEELQGNSNGTINRYLSSLSVGFNLAKRWYNIQIPYIPCLVEAESRKRIISKEEESKIVNYFGHKEMSALTIVLIDTGLRLSEALSLTKTENIDLIKNKITLWETKGNKSRCLPLTSRVRSIFSYCYRDKIFTLNSNQAEYEWAKMKKALGFDEALVIHSLRHTCITRWIESGEDVYKVKQLAGHSDIKTTEKYVHLNPNYTLNSSKAFNPIETPLNTTF